MKRSLPLALRLIGMALRIKDGTLHASFGEEGKPGFSTYHGKIEADGAASIDVNGLTNPAIDPLRRPPGTPFHYVHALQLKDFGGVGVRADPITSPVPVGTISVVHRPPRQTPTTVPRKRRMQSRTTPPRSNYTAAAALRLPSA